MTQTPDLFFFFFFSHLADENTLSTPMNNLGRRRTLSLSAFAQHGDSVDGYYQRGEKALLSSSLKKTHSTVSLAYTLADRLHAGSLHSSGYTEKRGYMHVHKTALDEKRSHSHRPSLVPKPDHLSRIIYHNPKKRGWVGG